MIDKKLERLREFEENTLLSAARYSLEEWEGVYKKKNLTIRTFRYDVYTYNLMLNEKYNKNSDEIKKYVNWKGIKKNKYYYLDDFHGIPYVLFDHSKDLESKDMTRLAEFIQLAKELVPGSLAIRMRALLASQNGAYNEEYPNWLPVSLAQEGIKAGRENFEVLLEAIKKRMLVQADVRNIHDPKNLKVPRVTLFPLMLKEYSNGWISGWYLLAYPLPKSNKLESWPNLYDLNVYPLDRLDNIMEAGPCLSLKPPPSDYNPADYFQNTIGVSRNNEHYHDKDTKGFPRDPRNKPNRKAEKIILISELRDHPWISSYIKTYPIHPSQKIKEDDQRKEMTIELFLEADVEFQDFCFKYAKDIKVLKPETLKNKILERLKEGLKYYGIE